VKKLTSLTLAFLGLFTFFLLPLWVLAQEITPPETVEEATELLPALIDALMNGKWVVVGALTVMVLTVSVRQYLIPKWNLSTDILPWVSIAIAFLNGVAAHAVGGVDVKEAAAMILISGGLASQIWSMGGKHFTDLLMRLFGKELAAPPESK